ncbi:Cupredoxin [Fusarium pseudocircinatum]|uniref:Cupredoxin n=1 Tax=Fusarium pseudocircinatum TaxID=56676 RepID=A0A8H5KTV8_9HYPO|nr:Cupredoxin [Fusarium pseudocircinatum]
MQSVVPLASHKYRKLHVSLHVSTGVCIFGGIDSREGRADGFEREVYLINGQQPGPLVDVDEGDDVEIFVQNDLNVETTIHWHGLLQRGTPHMDGVPGVTQDPIPPGGNFTYRFSTASEYGFFWYHSHFRAYYNDAIRGPLLIRPAISRPRPLTTLAKDEDDLAALLAAERGATNVLLNDWTHELSDVIFARYMKTGAFPSCVDSILANGRGRVQCLPKSALESGPGLGMGPKNKTTALGRSISTSEMQYTSDMSSMDMLQGRDMHDMSMDSSVSPVTSHPSAIMSMDHSTSPASSGVPEMPGMGSMSPRGCTPPMTFKPGFNMSSLPPETCMNTTSPLLVISTGQSKGWLALNLVNSGAVSALRVSLDGHSMFVYAADSLYTNIQEVNVLHMELGQRYSVMVKLDQPPRNYYLRFAAFPSGDMQQVLEGQAIVSYNPDNSSNTGVMEDPAKSWIYINGSAKADAVLLDPSALSPFDGHDSPPSGRPDKTLYFVVNQTDIVTWVIDRAPFSEPDVPIIYGENSSGWNSNTTIHLPINSTIDIILSISNQSLDMMGHPIHLHGHKFWVLGSGEGSFPYAAVTDAPEDLINLRDPPYRDTMGLHSQGWAAIRYVTDNPGAWMFHCHLQWHVVVGMAMVLVEGGDQLPALVGQYNKTADRSGATVLIASRYGPSATLVAIVIVAITLLY